MRKISANYIFPISQKPLKNGIIVVDNNGVIHDLIDTKGNLQETENIEFYNGIIVPGFVNAHSHIELSFMSGKIPQKQGMTNFVKFVENERNISEFEIQESIKNADFEMQKNGIVAVGDISNNNLSFETKQKSKIFYHTFVETFGVNHLIANSKFEIAQKLKSELEKLKLLSSIVPHSTYSVSKNLIALLNSNNFNDDEIISIHNSESFDEINLFKNKSGNLYNFINSIDETHLKFLSKFKNTSEYIIKTLNKNHSLISVHNTYSEQNDIELMSSNFEDLYWCFCPNSNLNIENKLPNIELFYKLNQNVVLGTDSLASNKKLSILEEMKTISENFPEIPFAEILKWATLNGAKALNLENSIGTLEIGKKPGINLIQNFNFAKTILSNESFVEVLVS
jgi:cytosine/adenosine deaminase-related metal-dependent hydrolase